MKEEEEKAKLNKKIANNDLAGEQTVRFCWYFFSISSLLLSFTNDCYMYIALVSSVVHVPFVTGFQDNIIEM